MRRRILILSYMSKLKVEFNYSTIQLFNYFNFSTISAALCFIHRVYTSFCVLYTCTDTHTHTPQRPRWGCRARTSIFVLPSYSETLWIVLRVVYRFYASLSMLRKRSHRNAPAKGDWIVELNSWIVEFNFQLWHYWEITRIRAGNPTELIVSCRTLTGTLRTGSRDSSGKLSFREIIPHANQYFLGHARTNIKSVLKI